MTDPYRGHLPKRTVIAMKVEGHLVQGSDQAELLGKLRMLGEELGFEVRQVNSVFQFQFHNKAVVAVVEQVPPCLLN